MAEVGRVVEAVHTRGARLTAHATRLSGTRVCAEAGVIRAGGPADFSLVHGDPLSDPTALWRVWRVA
jgi:imidazolonepropionase-like amidohydrolase